MTHTALYFVTSNLNKFREVQCVLPAIQQLDVALPELQSLDPREIIEHKLQHAMQSVDGTIIVEDTSLFFEGMDYKLPGPFIKYFLEGVGTDGLHRMAQIFPGKARALVTFGYADSAQGIVHFVEATSEGSIVAPRGDLDFGWGPVFCPAGTQKTFGEMERGEKAPYNPRILALHKLREQLSRPEMDINPITADEFISEDFLDIQTARKQVKAGDISSLEDTRKELGV